MMAQPYIRFYGSDWRSDPCLRLCSAASRGVWIDLISLMMESDRFGFLLINGRKPSAKEVATLTVTPLKVVKSALIELEASGVFSVTDDGIIFSRRMVRDAGKSLEMQRRGKMGGNPQLKLEVNQEDNQTCLTAEVNRELKTHARSHSHSHSQYKNLSQPALGVSDPRAGAREAGLAGLAELKIKEEWIIEAYDKREAQGMPYVDLKYEATKLTERWSNNPPDNPHAAWIGFAMKARAKQTNGAAGQDKYGYDIPPRGKRDSPKGPPPPLPKPH